MPIGFTFLRIARAWRRRQAAAKFLLWESWQARSGRPCLLRRRPHSRKRLQRSRQPTRRTWKHSRPRVVWLESGGRRRERRKQELAGKRSKKADKDPNQPKKPQTAYWLWLGENRASLSKEVGADVTKVAKLAGERWKVLPEKTKAPFEKTAAELKVAYTKALADYKKTAGDAGGDDDEEGAEEQ